MTTLTTLLVYAVSLLAPISTAWAVYDALVKWLAFPPWVAATSAVALELVGLAAVLVTLTLRRYNANKRKTDPGAPMALAYVIIGGYVVVAELLTVLLDPILTRWTLARGVFPMLSLVGFALAGLMDDHAARVAQVAAMRAQERMERAQRKSERAQDAQPKMATPASVASPAEATYPCGWGCGRTFGKLQARAAHMRKCAMRNGHEPEHVTAIAADGGK